jgi:hypothetical protein
MNDPRRFNPSELLGGADEPPSEAELADAYATARVLEAHALADRIGPTEGFEDRVMAAIATEPAPRVVLRPGPAVRGGRPAAFLSALRDSWAIATGGGRPMVVRAQALGFLLVVVVAAGSLGTVAAVGVGGLLQPQSTPVPTVAPISTSSPAPDASASPLPSPSPLIEPSPSPSATETLEPGETPNATETPEGTDDHGGASATETPGATDTAEPEDTTKPGETLKPGETPGASDDHGRVDSGNG